jgi:phage-related minor tail protein
VAFVAFTVKVDELPTVIEVGLAVIATVGAGLAVTVTVAAAEVFPPAPVAVAV